MQLSLTEKFCRDDERCDERPRSGIGFGRVPVHHGGRAGSRVSALPLSKTRWKRLQSAERRGNNKESS